MASKYVKMYMSSTQSGQCISCGKVSGTFLNVVRCKSNEVQMGVSLNIPVCDGCYNEVAKNEAVLASQCVSTNSILFALLMKSESYEVGIGEVF